MHPRTKFQYRLARTAELQQFIYGARSTIRGPPTGHFFSGVEWTEPCRIWRGHRPIIGAL